MWPFKKKKPVNKVGDPLGTTYPKPANRFYSAPLSLEEAAAEQQRQLLMMMAINDICDQNKPDPAPEITTHDYHADEYRHESPSHHDPSPTYDSNGSSPSPSDSSSSSPSDTGSSTSDSGGGGGW